MTDAQIPGEFDVLERDLSFLAEDVTFPITPVFSFPASTVAVAPIIRPSSMWWKVGLAAAVLLLAATLAFPAPRHALASWFDFPGIRIEIGNRDDDPPPTVTSIGGSLLLGTPVTLDEASERAGFPVMLPNHALTDAEPEVYLNSFQGAPVVSLLYPASNDLPSIGSTGVGLLLMEIDASGDTSIMIVKRATGETPPQSVTIDGNFGLWVQGGVLLTDAGDPFWTYQRRSGNVLVWEAGRHHLSHGKQPFADRGNRNRRVIGAHRRCRLAPLYGRIW